MPGSALSLLGGAQPLLAVLVMGASALFVLALGALAPSLPRSLTSLAAFGAALAAAVSWPASPDAGPALLMQGTLVVDIPARLASVACALFTAAALLVSACRSGFPDAAAREAPGLVLLTATAALVAVHAHHLGVLYLAVEATALGAHLLVGLHTQVGRAAEAAAKAFVTGAVAVGVFGLGLALLYAGSRGALGYEALALRYAASGPDPLGTLGLLLVFGALAFRVGVVPFHMSVPDLLEGGSLVAALLNVSVVRLALLLAFVRLLSVGFLHPALSPDGSGLAAAFGVLGLASVWGGALGSLRHDKTRRWLAHAAALQAGGVLVAFCALTQQVNEARQALGASLVSQVMALCLALSVSSLAPRAAEGQDVLDDWAGLGRTRPLLAFAMSVALMSLAGLPVSVGFVAQLSLLQAATASPWLGALVAAVLGGMILFAYASWRFVAVMYFQPASRAWSEPTPAALGLFIGGLTTLVLGFGLLPSAWLAWCVQLVPAVGP